MDGRISESAKRRISKSRQCMTQSFNPAQNKPRTLRKYAVPLVLVALTGLALILRTWDLNTTPPWLWWDEATQGLDAAQPAQRSVQGVLPQRDG